MNIKTKETFEIEFTFEELNSLSLDLQYGLLCKITNNELGVYTLENWQELEQKRLNRLQCIYHMLHKPEAYNNLIHHLNATFDLGDADEY